MGIHYRMYTHLERDRDRDLATGLLLFGWDFERDERRDLF